MVKLFWVGKRGLSLWTPVIINLWMRATENENMTLGEAAFFS